MNILLFSDDRIVYEDSEKGAIAAMLIPRYSKIKKYADITSPSDSTVKLRHGDADDLPALWRQEGPYVYVYGNISLELDEKRSTQHIYLPQDFVGEDAGAFYYIIGDRYVVHGVKSVTDDGQSVWGTSFIGEKEDAVIDVVVSSLSERMLEGKEERIVVAVHNNEDSFDNIAEALEPFDQEVIHFKDLGMPDKAIKPMFMRKDRSLFMLILSLCALLAMVGTVFLWGSGQVELAAEEQKSQNLQDAIRKTQKNKELGYIKSPKDILKKMSSVLPLPPSTLIHNAGQVGSMFGDLKEVKVGSKSKAAKKKRRRDKTKKNKGVLDVFVKVLIQDKSLLLDQERIANAVVESMPWIKYLEKPSGSVSKELKMGIQVK